MWAYLPFSLVLTLSAVPLQATHDQTVAVSCTLDERDEDWLAQTVSAWRYASRGFMQLDLSRPVDVYIMDRDCLLMSSDAMTGSTAPTWITSNFTDTAMIDGKMPLRPTAISFAGDIDGQAFFVMSAPTVWEEVEDGAPFKLETLMTAVWIHESSHTVQNRTYFEQFKQAAERLDLPSDWNDDSIQKRFKTNKDFSSSVARETELLFAAASDPSIERARGLAQEALTLIEARRARWYVGENAGLGEVEDIFLTMEGSGQWAGYTWLIEHNGGAVSRDIALSGFLKRGDWWSQTQGAALMLAVDRIGGTSWRQHAFGDGQVTGIEFLKVALLEPTTSE